MRVSLTVLGILGFLSPSIGVADNRRDLQELQGRWTVVFLERNGEGAGEEELKRSRIEMVIKGTRMTYFRDGKLNAKGIIAIDSSKNPKWLDLRATRSNGQSETAGGIYELEKGKLKICITLAGNPRPKEFKSEPGGLNVLMIYKRKGDN